MSDLGIVTLYHQECVGDAKRHVPHPARRRAHLRASVPSAVGLILFTDCDHPSVKEAIWNAFHGTRSGWRGLRRFFCRCIRASQRCDLRIGLSADVTTIDPALRGGTAEPYGAAAHLRWPHSHRRARACNAGHRHLVVDARSADLEVKLRPGVRFHDGTELTAEDGVHSLERPLRDQGQPGRLETYLRRSCRSRSSTATRCGSRPPRPTSAAAGTGARADSLPARRCERISRGFSTW